MRGVQGNGMDKYYKVNEGTITTSEKQKSRTEKDKDWEFVVKMTLIIRDLMKGNPKLRNGFQRRSCQA